MEITTLSLITLLDVQFDTPSPSPPIIGHPIPWNLLEAHANQKAQDRHRWTPEWSDVSGLLLLEIEGLIICS
ncbi:hypothetical protein Tco_1303671 [Tanacetum coccineum]